MDSHHSHWQWASAVYTDSRSSREERGSGILYISSFDSSCSHTFYRVDFLTFWFSQGGRGLPGPEGPEGAKGEPGLKGVKVSKWWIVMMLLKILNILHPNHVSSLCLTFLRTTIFQGVSRTCWNRRSWTKRGVWRESTFTLKMQFTVAVKCSVYKFLKVVPQNEVKINGNHDFFISGTSWYQWQTRRQSERIAF